MKTLYDKKLYIFDLDGTVYLGDTEIGNSYNSINQLRKLGKKICFLTNNSSRSRKTYFEKLNKIGIKCNLDEIYTSTIATISYLNEFHKHEPIYMLATEQVKKDAEDAGVNVVDENAKSDILVLAFDTELNYDKLWRANVMLDDNCKYIATHPDITCPSDRGNMPDVGGFIKFYESMTNRLPEVICGKPSSILAKSICKYYDILPEEMVMIGDRLYTDIKFGIDNNMVSVLVLSGETTKAMYEDFNEEIDYVFNNVDEMVENIINENENAI